MRLLSPNALPRHLAASLKTQRRRYGRQLARCQCRLSETAVHELRIQTRRMLALLDLLQTLYPEQASRKTRKVFKGRLDAFDELRDTHVQLILLKTLRKAFPEVRELDPWLRRREGKLIKALRKDIRKARQPRLDKRLRKLEKALRSLPAPDRASPDPAPLRAALDATFATLTARRRAIRPRVTATIHETRVAFKRYRYLAELLRPFLVGVTRATVVRMRRYQTLMGDIQDQEVLLAGLTRAREKGRLAPALGRRLFHAVRRRRAELVENYLRAADDLFAFEPARLTQSPVEEPPVSEP